MISVEGLCKRYGKLHAVKDVSFFVPKGQVLGLLGENGAGKSTTMNILTGCLAPSKGKISICGNDILLQPKEAKRKIGYLPEVAPLYDEMTVTSYLHFVCALRETLKSSIPAHIEEILEKTGLGEVKGRRIGNLSKGFRQRVGLAQALCGSPEILVLDEPTAGLDPLQTIEFRKLIADLSSEHTILFSTHILSEVQAVCNRVLILKNGELVCDKSLHDTEEKQIKLQATIAQGADSLLPALRHLQSATYIEKVKTPIEGATTVIITAPSGAKIERELFTLLSSLQAPLLRLFPVEDSLEDIFIHTTKRY